MKPGGTAARELGFAQSPALTAACHGRCGCHRQAAVFSGYGFPYKVALGENVLTRPLWQLQA